MQLEKLKLKRRMDPKSVYLVRVGVGIKVGVSLYLRLALFCTYLFTLRPRKKSNFLGIILETLLMISKLRHALEKVLFLN